MSSVGVPSDRYIKVTTFLATLCYSLCLSSLMMVVLYGVHRAFEPEHYIPMLLFGSLLPALCSIPRTTRMRVRNEVIFWALVSAAMADSGYKDELQRAGMRAYRLRSFWAVVQHLGTGEITIKLNDGVATVVGPAGTLDKLADIPALRELLMD